MDWPVTVPETYARQTPVKCTAMAKEYKNKWLKNWWHPSHMCVLHFYHLFLSAAAVSLVISQFLLRSYAFFLITLFSVVSSTCTDKPNRNRNKRLHFRSSSVSHSSIIIIIIITWSGVFFGKKFHYIVYCVMYGRAMNTQWAMFMAETTQRNQLRWNGIYIDVIVYELFDALSMMNAIAMNESKRLKGTKKLKKGILSSNIRIGLCMWVAGNSCNARRKKPKTQSRRRLCTSMHARKSI